MFKRYDPSAEIITTLIYNAKYYHERMKKIEFLLRLANVAGGLGMLWVVNIRRKYY